MLGAERALRDGLELGPHALALPPIARGGRDWMQEEKGTTEDEMAGWHH